MTGAPIRLEGVTRLYAGSGGGVRNLSLRVEAGTCYGLLGRNGAGKTTALRLLMGMLRPASGAVHLMGCDPFTDPVGAKARVGYLAEDQEMPAGLRPLDLYRLYATVFPGWNMDRALGLADRLRVPVDRSLGSLSKGQARLAGLVGAVAHEPAALVLDEPGGGLDPAARRDLLEEVARLLADSGTAVIFSSHILGEVERVADRIGFLDHGALRLEGDVADLRDRSCRVLVDADVAGALDRVPGCVAVGGSGAESLRTLTLLCTPDEARQRVREHLGREPRRVDAVSLEDLFVDLVGDRR